MKERLDKSVVDSYILKTHSLLDNRQILHCVCARSYDENEILVEVPFNEVDRAVLVLTNDLVLCDVSVKSVCDKNFIIVRLK